MACGLGLPDAEDCAADHWSLALDGRREPSGQWRAACPFPGCGTLRSLEYDAPGKHVRWKSFCGDHDKDAIRPHLARLIGSCMPGGSRREAISHDEQIELALSGVPPMTMKLMMLRMAGLGTAEALDKLGVRPDHRARVIGGRTGGAPKRARNRRS